MVAKDFDGKLWDALNRVRGKHPGCVAQSRCLRHEHWGPEKSFRLIVEHKTETQFTNQDYQFAFVMVGVAFS